eukprot:m.161306 g.161306  ORF g.161306 m.161306 type:complete len:118 (+) comp16524_c0_seq2:3075-3428(+)
MLGDYPQARKTWSTVQAIREAAYGDCDSKTVAARSEQGRIAKIIAAQKAPRTLSTLIKVQTARTIADSEGCQDCHEALPSKPSSRRCQSTSPRLCTKCAVFYRARYDFNRRQVYHML